MKSKRLSRVFVFTVCCSFTILKADDVCVCLFLFCVVLLFWKADNFCVCCFIILKADDFCVFVFTMLFYYFQSRRFLCVFVLGKIKMEKSYYLKFPQNIILIADDFCVCLSFLWVVLLLWKQTIFARACFRYIKNREILLPKVFAKFLFDSRRILCVFVFSVCCFTTLKADDFCVCLFQIK